MEFQDSTRIDTPEGIGIELTLAGLGSRMLAQLLDNFYKALVLIALSILTQGAFSLMGWIAIGVVVFLAWEWVFELVWDGRTPGKKANGLRVVSTDGSAADATAISIRNMARIVDVIPGAYGIGGVLVFATKRAQRVGDLLAGTIVIRDNSHVRPATTPFQPHIGRVRAPDGLDVTMVSQEHVALGRAFLERRASLDNVSRQQLAVDIANKMAPHVVDPTGNLAGEKLIEVVVAVKTGAIEGP